jgi:hypothetical protein
LSWSQKLIEIDVTLAGQSGTIQPTSFAESLTSGLSANTVTLTGCRASVRIRHAGAAVGCEATIKVWGLTQSLMNQMSTLGLSFNIVPHNIITVKAGDAMAPLTPVFQGTIYSAYGDYEAQPDVPMTFTAVSGGGANVSKAPVFSWSGQRQVVDLMQTIATAMGLTLENNGVTGFLVDGSLGGTYYDQAQAIAEQADIQWAISNNTLSIWPTGGVRSTIVLVPVISAATGMIGYPAYTQQGIIVKTLFNPQIQFGAPVQINSSLLSSLTIAQTALNPNFIAPQSNIWSVNHLDHALDSLLPEGLWQSTVQAYNPNQTKPLPGV